MNVVYLIRTKDEAIDTLERFIDDIVIPNGFRLERLRSDCGGEYTAEYYKKFCKTIGIVQEFTAPATPQQNGISERAGRTLMNIVRCLMHGGQLPEYLWGELCCTAVHITNRLPHVHLNNETPYYRMFGKQASLRHLRVIGSSAFVHVETYKTKLANRAWPGILVGYSPNSNAYRIYNPHTKRIVPSRNVTFIEPMDAAMPPVIPTIEELRDYEPENELSVSADVDIPGNEREVKDNSKYEEDYNEEEGQQEQEQGIIPRMHLRSSGRNTDIQQATNNKRQQAELRRLSPWNKLATFLDQDQDKTKI